MIREIYMDNTATSKVDKDVLRAMIPYLSDYYANPSSPYSIARRVRSAVEEARQVIAETIDAKADEIYFTSSGTEANNWALVGSARLRLKNHRFGRIITSQIEHPSIINTCHYLSSLGFDVKYVSVNSNGIIDLDELCSYINDDTFIISVMGANNEIGTIQPIEDIAVIAKRHNILFHTDAVQAYGHIPLTTNNGIQLLSASAHKINGPKGIGFLYKNTEVSLEPLLFGGSQENGLRGSTENVPGIIGMKAAASKWFSNYLEWARRTRFLSNMLVNLLKERIDRIIFTGHSTYRMPHLVSFCIAGVDANYIIRQLDKYNVYLSSGSACHNSRQINISHVLSAIDLPDLYTSGAIRISLDESITEENINYIVNVLVRIIDEYRSWND